ncbi:TPA: hypothetical protein ACPPBN_000121 [Haemophilus influenzae]
MKNGVVAESGAQAGEYPNVDISKHICQYRETTACETVANDR